MAKNQKQSNHSNSSFQHMIIHVTDVKVLRDYQLWLKFDDDVEKEIDLWPILENRSGLFNDLKDKSYFKKVVVNHETGTIQWPNELDIAPDVLYQM